MKLEDPSRQARNSADPHKFGGAPTAVSAFASQHFSFSDVSKLSTELPPRGHVRVHQAAFRRSSTGRSQATAPRNRTTNLFFDLLQAPFYQELVLRHWAGPMSGVHGPFLCAHLQPRDFEQLTPDDFDRRIERILGDTRWEPSSAKTIREGILNLQVAAASDAFVLKPGEGFDPYLATELQHEWSHAVVEFHEFLLVSWAAQRLTVLMLVFD